MAIDFTSWIGLALRWFHVMVGIMWIGASFYFVWLDLALRPPAREEDKAAGVGGELWAVHGGGFYNNKKYLVAPPGMPEELHWFKWEAYLTFLSGFLLLCTIYYLNAKLYLIDDSVRHLEPWQAIVIGLGFIAGGWIVYDVLCRSPLGRDDRLLALIWAAVLVASAYALCHIFSGRGAFIHVGAMIGTVMAANVFAIIIPNQKKTVAIMLKGEKPPAHYGQTAKQRSMHNNYMTLPVLLIMISNHYPMLYTVPYNWLILSALCLASVPIREFFNQKDRGNVNYSYAAVGVVGFLVVMIAASRAVAPAPVDFAGAKVSPREVRRIVRTHCSPCHSDTPLHAGIPSAPKGIMFDTMDEIKQHAAEIEQQAVKSNYMPLGNETKMTPEERARLGIGLQALTASSGSAHAAAKPAM
ncbi:MAG TPA: urate hydroxylase PuuD [Candidatus Acidoferrales bacterium]|jgi:uncharacterized membrane protein|nr:urate hydroxylase PuuD [Candidatus Acidoferrales bacterium]